MAKETHDCLLLLNASVPSHTGYFQVKCHPNRNHWGNHHLGHLEKWSWEKRILELVTSEVQLQAVIIINHQEHWLNSPTSFPESFISQPHRERGQRISLPRPPLSGEMKGTGNNEVEVASLEALTLGVILWTFPPAYSSRLCSQSSELKWLTHESQLNVAFSQLEWTSQVI